MKLLSGRNRYFDFPIWLLTGAALISFFSVMWRDVWFDEAMTLLFYTGSETSPAGIYFNYHQANNHIGYSVLLWLWRKLDVSGSVIFLRLLSLIPALAALWILYFRHWREAGGRKAWALILGGFALSPCFAIYSTALRGYMWGLLATVLIYEFACGYLNSPAHGWRNLGGFVLASALGFLILPTDIAPAAGAVCLAVRGEWWRQKRFWVLAVLIPAVFAAVYAPLFGNLLEVATSGECWKSSRRAALAAGAGFLITMAPAVLFLPFGRIRKSVGWMNLGPVWIPVLIFLLCKYPPFPRNFLPFWPLWLIMLGRGWRLRLCMMKHARAAGKALTVLLMLTLVWSFGERMLAEKLSSVTGGARFDDRGQDDWFAPYYMRDDFAIRPTVEFLESKFPASRVFVTFAADGFPFLIYGGTPSHFLLWNTPEHQLYRNDLIVTAADEGDRILNALMDRFNLVRRPEAVYENSFHKVYKVK